MLLWALLFLGLAAILIIGGRRQRAAAGVPRGAILYSDTARWNRLSRPLFSRELQLTGKPDYVVRAGKSVVPVEVKSGPSPVRGPYDSHVLQLAAYCALIQTEYGVRPPYGLIQYADEAFTVDFTTTLEKRLYDLLDEMRAEAHRAEVARSHGHAARCRSCGFNYLCEQSLV